jgi:hypothetical protein
MGANEPGYGGKSIIDDVWSVAQTPWLYYPHVFA